MIQYKIAILIPYFGSWPIWMPYYLSSCRYNPNVDFLFFTNLPPLNESPGNVIYHKMNFDTLIKLAEQKLRLEIKFEAPYKLCDLKPAYGLIFQDYISDYDFWGHGDIDLIYGRISSFYTRKKLKRFDVLTCRRGIVSGQLTLYRNLLCINSLFLGIKNLNNLINSSRSEYVDEQHMYTLLKEKKGTVKTFFKEMLSEDALNRMRNRHHYLYSWKNGRLVDMLLLKETLLFHFIENKRKPLFTDSFNKQLPNQEFLITEKGIIIPTSKYQKAGFILFHFRKSYKYLLKRLAKKVLQPSIDY